MFFCSLHRVVVLVALVGIVGVILAVALVAIVVGIVVAVVGAIFFSLFSYNTRFKKRSENEKVRSPLTAGGLRLSVGR